MAAKKEERTLSILKDREEVMAAMCRQPTEIRDARFASPPRRIFMRAATIAVLVVGISASCACAGEPAVVFDVRGLTYDELCTVEALQGLANRKRLG